MSSIICKTSFSGAKFALLGILLFMPIFAAAKCGGVDYSWGADALASAHDYTVTMMLYVLYLIYAIASIIGALTAALLWEAAGKPTAVYAGMGIVIAIRLLSAHFRWNLPRIDKEEKSET